MSEVLYEELDVLIVGSGISGIGAARYLSTESPSTTYAVLEARAASGGTWDQFRYPGIRSDSDLFTFGYEFKPWTDKKAIATGDKILAYLRETAAEAGVDEHIRYHHKVVSASWSSEQARWTVEVDRADTGERVVFRVRWLFGATGYYDYDEGFTPRFEGREDFEGQITHPQHWPEDLDYAGKRIVVIGSGATAVTLIPALAAGGAGHVTMLQRTPTYVLPLPSEDKIANLLPKIFGAERGYALTRRKNVWMQQFMYKASRRYPNAVRRFIRNTNARALPAGFDVDTHFNPPYDPWDQRLCMVPDSDLFRTISAGNASVVTARIDKFTRNGILLETGEELEADIVVTATGFNIKLFGGIAIDLDGRPLVPSEHVAYKGMMLSGIPNFAFSIGYTHASWTLKVGLLCEHFTKLVNYMDANDYDVCVADAPDMTTGPLLDFSAGYVKRSIDMMPRKGDAAPWAMSLSYIDDVRLVRHGSVLDEFLQFSRVDDDRTVVA
ncbi:flavin-containing monooxygenase [Williamsia sterculiae]|uniref:Predicted flavoprotein CzcO associated with the cation diffusion facilitator CzcD n=1 Tax=Williamsia sterculiae TaxID=1344003 RepID=A0A1N7HFC2_9NOCA|nr:NAD(P)/FAD-dependent oxidoreductase [Williamsia sterculiae]SIS23421.1 Predicted flavoprotein CzcO associated with the cation diffusion facilitator CzcD [Williamsia sterculiae]